MTNHSLVPSSLCEITSERIASSLARPPALRMTWASPSARPASLAGSIRASMQVRMAKPRAGGKRELALVAELVGVAVVGAEHFIEDLGHHGLQVGRDLPARPDEYPL